MQQVLEHVSGATSIGGAIGFLLGFCAREAWNGALEPNQNIAPNPAPAPSPPPDEACAADDWFCWANTLPGEIWSEANAMATTDTGRIMLAIAAFVVVLFLLAWWLQSNLKRSVHKIPQSRKAESRKPVVSDVSMKEEEADSDTDVEDIDRCGPRPKIFSEPVNAAYDALRKKHGKYKGVCWNATHGMVMGDIWQSPPGKYFKDEKITKEIENTHSDALPERMGSIIASAEEWVDFSSLGPPDGKFLHEIQKALKWLHDDGRSVTVRFLTGNIIGMPTDNHALLEQLITFEGFKIPEDTNLRIWVGSWRKGLTWNHSKIIAVDGRRLFTGGHNVWDPHYLQLNPVRDVSIELGGLVSVDGHNFVDRMWNFIIKYHKDLSAQRLLPSWVPVIGKRRVNLVSWPKTAEQYPPLYRHKHTEEPSSLNTTGWDKPMLTIGRYGSLHHKADTANPSDSAVIALLGAAKRCIKMSLQDLGPIAVPLPGAGVQAIPGGVWPKEYLREIGKAIYTRRVDVQIVLSNPNSIPDHLGVTQANYGNGWTCADVEAEIIKAIQNEFDEDERQLAERVCANLKVAFCRTSLGECDWLKRKKAGNHAKFFIVDDQCFYVGSQNLYIANLAEWGVIIDHQATTHEILADYWNKLWEASYVNVPEAERDADLDAVLQACDVIANPPVSVIPQEELEKMMLASTTAAHAGHRTGIVLTVWLKRAKNLKDADSFWYLPFFKRGGSDAYVILKLLDKNNKIVGAPQRSSVLANSGANPVWNEQFDFEGLNKKEVLNYRLELSVWDEDEFLGFKGAWAKWLDDDDHLGSATVELGSLKKTTAFQDVDLVIDRGWFSSSKLSIGLNTNAKWGRK